MSFLDLKSENFQQNALEIYNIQLKENGVYKHYCQKIKHKQETKVMRLEDIPYLPISFFKTHQIFKGIPEKIFYSSGTTSSKQLSQHRVKSIRVYEDSFLKTFKNFYGNIKNYIILALLPNYLERENSSLVYMISKLMNETGCGLGGFYLDNFKKLQQDLKFSLKQERKIPILIGVSYALLDFSEKHPMPLEHTIIMETGGMKGRREEIIRQELHNILKRSFQVNQIHSEYGMTELLSQAYSKSDGIFMPPNWMKILIRDPYDPFSVKTSGKGLINIIDLANIHSCSFIATDDIGEVLQDGTFMIHGRYDFSEVRGCNLLYNA